MSRRYGRDPQREQFWRRAVADSDDQEPDPGLANHLLWLVNFGCSNDVKQESRSSPVGVGYDPSTKK